MESVDNSAYSDILRYVTEKYCKRGVKGAKRPFHAPVQTIPKQAVKDSVKSLHKRVSSINARLILNTKGDLNLYRHQHHRHLSKSQSDKNSDSEKKNPELEKNH